MKNDKQKKKNGTKSKKQNKYRALSLVLTSSLVIAPLTVPLTFYLPGGITASAAILDAEILSNITSSNDSGTTSGAPWASDGSSKNVDFTISGSALVGGSVIKTGTKQAVLTVPTQLKGNVTPNGTAQINTNVTITVGQLSFLTATLTAANNLATLLNQISSGTIASLTGVTLDLTTVQQQLNLLNNIENFGSASFTSTPTLSADGSYISANIDDGLGVVLSQNITTILQNLKSAVDALHATGTGLTGPASAILINTALAPVKLAVDGAINTAVPLVQAGGTGFNQLLDASLLGSTTINIPTTVVSPTNLTQNLDAKFVGTVVQTDTIDVNLLNTANGVSDIYYAGTAAVVQAPVVTNTTGTSATGYTVTGTATAGDTVNILNAGGTVIGTATADPSGNFSATIAQGKATASEALTAVAVDGGGNQSTPTPFTTPADPTAVAAPVVTNTTGTSTTGYTVTGTATAGNTVNILNAGGTVIGTATADPSGNFSATIAQGKATASEALTAVAVDGGGDQSTPTPFTTPADPVVIPAPTVTGVTGTSATGYTVTGTATAGDIVSIKNAGGTVIGTATADPSGNYTATIPTGLATPEEALTATASDGSGNQSPATPFTTPADPVVVPAPTVTSVTGNSATGYTVTGTATPGDTVSIKNPGGTVIGTTIADPSGNYTAIIPVGSATPNEQLSAVATDGAGNSSVGTPFTTPADPVVVPAPTVTNVTGTSATGYTVTGTATPGDTVSIKNTGGTVIGSGVANASGNYTVTIPTGLATPVEQLKAIASDADGNQSTATPFTTPADPVVVPAPTVTSVTGNSGTGYTVTGTAPAGDLVSVKNAGGTVIGTAIADPSGNYTLIIPTGAATPNEQLTATATDGAGNSSAGTSFKTPADPIVVPAPTVTGVTGTAATGYTVTGAATPGDTVSIKNTGGTVIGTAVANAGGNYTVTIPTGLATPVEQLKAIASDADGNQSTATPFTTPADPVVVPAPTVTSVTGNSGTGYTVTGTAPAGDLVSVKNAGGTVVGTAIADPSGNYTLVIPTGAATPNEQLTATATDGAGNSSAGTSFTTPADPVVVVAPTVTGVTGTAATGYTVTGAATPGDTVSIKNTGGTVIGTAVANAGGNYTVTIPTGLATPVEQLKAVASDVDGNQSTATPFTTPADPVVVTAPTVTSVTGNSGTGYTVTGTAPAGDVVTIKNSGGTVVGTATADPSGNYTVVIPAGAATPNEQLTATATDGAGNSSAGTSFTTPADPTVVTAPTVTGVSGNSGTGYTVTGVATPGNTVSIKNTGGTVIGTAVANAGGNYTVTIPTGLATPVEQLKAVASDADGNQSTATPFTTPADPVVVPAPTVTGVTGNSGTGYTVTGTAPAGDVVTIKNSGGTVVGTATADPSGNFTVTIPTGSATPNEQLTATATDGAGNSSAGTSFTTPADPAVVVAPTVTGVTGKSSTGYTVTGTATPGDTVSIKNTGGTVIGTAVANAGGNYTVTIPTGLATPVEQLKAVASDADGNQSTATPFTTPADPAVVPAPTVTSVTGNSGTGYTVTGTAPAGDVVTIKNSGGTVVGTATADPSGNYTVTIPAGAATPNEQLTATATDGAGNSSAGTSFTTPADPVTVIAPSVTGVTGTAATGYTVTGAATPGDTVNIKNTNGTTIGTAVANAGGNYTVTIPTGLATPLEQLKAIASDPDGNQSTATPFTTPADPVTVVAPTVTGVTGNSKSGYTVTGKATAGNTVEIRNVSGTVIGTNVADSSGNYTAIIPVGSATPNEQLKAVAKDGSGNTSSATPFKTPADPKVVVPTPTISKVSGNSLTGYTILGKAAPGDKVEIRNVDGTLLGQAVAGTDGVFEIKIPIGFAFPSEALKAIAKDSNNNQSEPANFNLPPDSISRSVTPPKVISVNGNSTTGYTVVGTADPDDVIKIYNVNGVLVGTAEVDGSGNYSVKLLIGMVMPNEKDTAVSVDPDGNLSAPTEFLIPADSGNGNGNGNGNGTNNNGNGSSGLLTSNGRYGSGTQKDLPNNGEIVNNWGLVGALLLGGLGVFGFIRKSKKEEE